MSHRRLWALVCGLLLVLPTRAELNEAEQRSALQQQRLSAEAQHTARKAECAQVFAVVACEEKARSEHRTQMRRLREQEQVLNDAQRQRRAQTTQARLAAKTQAPLEAPAAPPVEALPRKKVLADAAPGVERTAKRSPDRPADVGARRERFEARQREAQSHREQIELRNAARAASGVKARPLPAAPGASDR